MPSNQAASPTPPLVPASPAVASPGESSGTFPAPQGVDKSGGPSRAHLIGNAHRATHGVWSFLALGKLPKGASYIRRLMGELRRELEARVTEAQGQIDLPSAALIVTVCRHEGRALLLSRWLAHEGAALKLTERLSLVESIGRATDARDKAIAALRLTRTREDETRDMIARMYGPASRLQLDAPDPAGSLIDEFT